MGGSLNIYSVGLDNLKTTLYILVTNAMNDLKITKSDFISEWFGSAGLSRKRGIAIYKSIFKNY